MTKTTRRLLAVVCIAVLVVTAMLPAGLDLSGVIVRLGPLFGTVRSVPIPEEQSVHFAAAPFRSVRSSRAPPTA
ncbi:MAG: hypothetical protein AUJ01_01285 [Acidobacteria bacterium 13_1_40CM_3_65_5]|jgi:hypothetical protein|nr:MAG: hypothetical protein AUJ01_01285 [Acidobacteria bacterium 13_1_40CM_3_65_5]OLE78824.1 MAG: hypothetical protein AUF76_18520 [Acidobacteria bacterium 13_1_20CM_2_65_9]